MYSDLENFQGQTVKNISLYRNSDFHYKSPVPYPSGGAFRDRHVTLGAGCDGRGRAQVSFHLANAWLAVGEVVWSWRRDPGVYLAGGIPLTTVTTKAAHRGEHV